MIAGYLPCERPDCSNVMPLCLDEQNTSMMDVMCGQCGQLHYVYPNSLASNAWVGNTQTADSTPSRLFGFLEMVQAFFQR